jgi:chorismate mutase
MMSSRLLPAFFLALSLALLPSCATKKATEQAPPVPTALQKLIAERLQVGRQVAWIKYRDSLPVQDKKREAELMDSLVAQGQALGLPEDTVRRFFGSQITASRILQTQLIGSWKKGSTLPAYPPMDLRRDIRPMLDRISAEMLRQFAAGPQAPTTPTRAYLRSQGFSPAVSSAASSGGF